MLARLQDFEAEMAAQQEQNAPPPPSQSPTAGSRSDEPDPEQQPDSQQAQDGSGGVSFPEAYLRLLELSAPDQRCLLIHKAC